MAKGGNIGGKSAKTSLKAGKAPAPGDKAKGGEAQGMPDSFMKFGTVNKNLMH